MYVIVTDYIQYITLSLGFLFCIFFSIKTIGWSSIFSSLENIRDYNKIYNPIKNLGLDYISWQVVLGFVSAVVWPTAITRALSLKDVGMVKEQYIWSSFSFLIRFIFPCFIGICAFIYYSGEFQGNSLALLPRY